MENYTNKRVLVTGASGFIGSHLVDALIKLGAEVFTTQHQHSSAETKVFCDLRDAQQVERVVFSTEPEYVFHLASQAVVGLGEANARYTLETNIMGSVNLLESLSRLNHVLPLKSVVVASTDKVMGRQEVLPYQEDAPLLGTHQVYEASKTCEDVLAQMAAHSWGLPIGITRFGNVYGGGDMNFSRLIPGVVSAYIHQERPVLRSDGLHYRDYLYVDDVVDGYLRLGKYVAEHSTTCPHTFNFGAGKPYRVLDVVAMIQEHFPKGEFPQILDKAKDEIERQYVSGEKALALLNWYPKTNLKDGIEKTIAWYREYFDVESN